MVPEIEASPQYSIGLVAQRTGLSTHVLRAWERRYELVEPRRDANGVRSYSSADTVRLRLLKRVTDAGHPIGLVAPCCGSWGSCGRRARSAGRTSTWYRSACSGCSPG